MAKQTDTETLQVCNKTTEHITDNTDDDFNGITGKMQVITDPVVPNEKLISIIDNPHLRIEPGKCFPTVQGYLDHKHNNLQAVPSDDQSLDDIDYDGPSRLLMAMELFERKDHHVPRSLNTWERILFSGSYYGEHLYVFHVCCML